MFGLMYAVPMPGTHDLPMAMDFNASSKAAAESFKRMAEQVEELSKRTSELAAGERALKFEQAVRQLAQDRPAMTISAALAALDNGSISMTGATLRERAEWVLSQQDIVDLMVDRKINAIKEIRARTHLGLKEAKDAVEYAADLQKQGWMSPAERAKLEEEAREAIASIRAVLPGPSRCDRCGHAPHPPGGCLNIASDNDCDC